MLQKGSEQHATLNTVIADDAYAAARAFTVLGAILFFAPRAAEQAKKKKACNMLWQKLACS